MDIEEWYELTEREDERAARRRIAARAAMEFAAVLAVAGLVAVAAWLYLASTPSQWSAEADAAAEASGR